MKIRFFIGFLAMVFLSCTSGNQVAKEDLVQVPACMKQQLLEAKKLSWSKQVSLDNGKFELSEAKNWQKDLTWLSYFQIPANEKDQFNTDPSLTNEHEQVWTRKNEDSGLQQLALTGSANGQCESATALVLEKNMLFERKLSLNARFHVADTSAIFTISGSQKIIFSEPVNFLVTYYALQP